MSYVHRKTKIVMMPTMSMLPRGSGGRFQTNNRWWLFFQSYEGTSFVHEGRAPNPYKPQPRHSALPWELHHHYSNPSRETVWSWSMLIVVIGMSWSVRIRYRLVFNSNGSLWMLNEEYGCNEPFISLYSIKYHFEMHDRDPWKHCEKSSDWNTYNFPMQKSTFSQ